MSGVIGNLMAAYVVSSVKQSTFYFVMTGFCLMSSLFFLFLKTPIKTGLKVPEEKPEKNSVAQDIKETLQLLMDPRMLKILPFIVL